MQPMGKARNNPPADLIEFREAMGTRRQLEKLGGGIVEYSKPTRKRRMAQPFQTSTGKFPTARATARDALSAPSYWHDRMVNAKPSAENIADRIMGTLVLVKPKRCICCGALAHEVAHD